MKKLLFIVSLLFCVSINSNAQTDMKVCGYFDGFWSNWMAAGGVEINGNYDGFIIYLPKEGPWEYRFKFKINNMTFPDKKQRKKDIKANKWYQFSGTVEYYISDDYLSAIELFRSNKGPKFLAAKQQSGRPTKKITSKATIKIAAFKDYPKVYNIFYDKVGFGIDLGSGHFPIEPFK